MELREVWLLTLLIQGAVLVSVDEKGVEGVEAGLGSLIHPTFGNVNGAAEKAQFEEQFAKHLTDMKPDEIVNFELNAGEHRVFVQPILVLPIRVKGVYSVSASPNNKIGLRIYYPNGTLYLSHHHKKDAIFLFDPDTTGNYKFVFANRNVWVVHKSVLVFYDGDNQLWNDPAEG